MLRFGLSLSLLVQKQTSALLSAPSRPRLHFLPHWGLDHSITSTITLETFISEMQEKYFLLEDPEVTAPVLVKLESKELHVFIPYILNIFVTRN